MSDTLSSSSPFPFLALPRELRDHIYSYVFSSPEYRENSSRRSHAALHRAKLIQEKCGNEVSDDSELNRVYFPESCLGQVHTTKYNHTLPALCYVSQQMYWESAPVYLQCCTILSQDTGTTDYLLEWLDRFPHSSGFLGITSMVAGVDTYSISKPYDLIVRCTNLRELTVVLGSWGKYETTLEQLVSFYQLSNIVDIPKLQKLYFDFDHDVSVLESLRFTPLLKDWFYKSWGDRGRVVVVSCNLWC